jgi:hypothetical protein
MMSNINRCTISIQNRKIFLKGRPFGMRQFEKVQP